MGFYSATVETSNGEILDVLHNGMNNGKSLLAFLQGLDGYCSNIEGDYSWFAKLEIAAKEPLRSICKPLLTAWYGWDEPINYKADEYTFFKHRYPDIDMTETDYKRFIESLEQRWANLNDLTKSVGHLLTLCRTANPGSDVAWYDPVDTPDALEGLYDTLRFFQQREKESEDQLARIRIA